MFPSVDLFKLLIYITILRISNRMSNNCSQIFRFIASYIAQIYLVMKSPTFKVQFISLFFCKLVHHLHSLRFIVIGTYMHALNTESFFISQKFYTKDILSFCHQKPSKASMSRLIVRRETSYFSVSSGAVTFSFCKRIGRIPISRSIFIFITTFCKFPEPETIPFVHLLVNSIKHQTRQQAVMFVHNSLVDFTF